jgi:hypothetical protein
VEIVLLGVKFVVLAGVEDVEAGDPADDSRGEQQDGEAEGLGHGNPCADGGEAERRAEHVVGEVGEALGEAVTQEDGEGGAARYRQVLLSMAAARKKTRAPATREESMKPLLSCPVTRARAAVRGLRASKRRSTRRLKDIAAVRAAMQAATIQKTTQKAGSPLAATSMAISANGRAKTECENLIDSRKVAVLSKAAFMGAVRWRKK